MDHIEKCLSSGCLAFLYDTAACRREEDDPCDAVTFFTGLRRRQLTELLPLVSDEFLSSAGRGRCCADADDCERSDEAIQLVSQLMGTVLFLERNVSFPDRITLATGQCVFHRDGRFVWALYVSDRLSQFPARILLDKLRSTFLLLYGDLTANFRALSWHMVKLQRRLHCLLRPLVVHVLGTELITAQSAVNSSHITATEESMTELRRMLASLKANFNGLFVCVFVSKKLLVSTVDCTHLTIPLEALTSLSKSYFAISSSSNNKLSEESLMADILIESEVFNQLDSSSVDDSTDHLLDSSGNHLDSSSAPPEMSSASIDSDGDSMLSSCRSPDSPANTELIGNLARLAIRAQQQHRGGSSRSLRHPSLPDSGSSRRRRRRGSSSALRLAPVMVPSDCGTPVPLYRRHCVKSSPMVSLMLLLNPRSQSGSGYRRISLSALEREAGYIVSRVRQLLSSPAVTSRTSPEANSAGHVTGRDSISRI